MKKTIFTTPILSFIFRQISNVIMFLAGWRIKGKLPNIPKYVLIGAPHTSNWDFVLFLGAIFYLKADVRYMGKAELFRFPYGWFFYYCGGVPVDRKKSTGLVEQMIEACNKADKFVLTIAPEGTRHKVAEWKSGFHRIARGADIPIVMAKVDGANKIMHVGEVFHPTDNLDADMKLIQESFKGMTGINPSKKYITLER